MYEQREYLIEVFCQYTLNLGCIGYPFVVSFGDFEPPQC